jgi:choline dehydrogenase-like flavoprotein
MSPASEELFDFFLGKGLHPYRLPMACEFRSGCECCQGYLCDKSCKNDSARICLMPSLAEYGADLIDECTVVKLECLRSEVTDIICYHRGRWLRLHGKIVVLAAGALETPRILLSSASTAWPNGLANGSGLVGRNLMRHYIDLYAIRAKTKLDFIPSLKELAFNDLYISGGQKLGTVQAFGALPPAEILVDGIQEEFRQGAFPIAASLFGAVKPAMRIFLKHLFHRRIILAGLMEDLPYSENMVALSNKTDEYGRRNIIIKYCISENERKRIEAFRKELSKILKPYHFVLIKQAENNERIAHACGTCRFGTDPKESVLDPYNRAHGLSNLYVVDSSFFPSSGGTNPALTIAANALRVAAHLISIGRG